MTKQQPTIPRSERVEWIDGLKGIGCLMIFLHHFLLTFLPATYYGVWAVSHIQGDTLLAYTPLGSFVNGRFWVYIFMALSGMLVSLPHTEQVDLRSLSGSAFRRYFSLALPVTAATVFCCALSALGAYSNLQACAVTGSMWLTMFYTYPLSFLEGILYSLSVIWVRADNTFNGVYWMLPYILSGSFLCYMLCIVLADRKKHRLWLLLIPFMIFLYGEGYLICFVIGYGMAVLMRRVQGMSMTPARRKWMNAAGLVMILAGLFFGGYPTEIEPVGIYECLNFSLLSLNTVHVWKTLGTVLMLGGILICAPAQRLLSIRPVRALGSISFALYLLHIPILFSLSTSFFMMIQERTGRYVVSVLLTLAVTLAAVTAASTLFHATVEKASGKVVQRLAKRMEDPA